jgi:hypothetical protein
VAARGLQLAAIALQVAAPKCAVCWTTYAGLLDASWFAATRFNPVWFAAMLCIALLMFVMHVHSAWRTRRYGIALLTLSGWGLVIGGSLIGVIAIRVAGVAILGGALIGPRWRAWAVCAKGRA